MKPSSEKIQQLQEKCEKCAQLEAEKKSLHNSFISLSVKYQRLQKVFKKIQKYLNMVTKKSVINSQEIGNLNKFVNNICQRPPTFH